MNVPLAVVAVLLTAALVLLGYLGKRTIRAFDAITSTQEQIAHHFMEHRVAAKSRHEAVMEKLREIADAIGLTKRVEALEEAFKQRVAAPTSRSGGSRGSRPDR